MAAPEKIGNKQPVEKTSGTTVFIQTEGPSENPGITCVYGSNGFFVAPGKIVTNVHVLAGATKVTAKCVDTETVYTLEGIIAFDGENDLAVLKIAEEGTPFLLGDSDIVQKGDRIWTLGYHGDKKNRVEGTLLGTRQRGQQMLLNVKLADGWSGSPVLNSDGQVIAVFYGENRSGDVGYATSSNILKALLTETENAKVESLSTWRKRWEVQVHSFPEALENRYTGVIGIVRLIYHLVKSSFYGVRARKKISKGDYEQAIAICDKIIEEEFIRFFTPVYAIRGIAKSELENHQDAITDATENILLHPEDYYGYYSRGYANRAFGKAKAAQGDIKEAQRLYREAISDFTEAINLEPEKAKIYNSRGWSKYLLGQVETKKEKREKARKLFQEAIFDSDEALRLQPKGNSRAAFYHTRGAAKAALGYHYEAIADLNEAIRLKPEKALYYHNRGLSKEAVGQHTDAETDFAKATEIATEFEK